MINNYPIITLCGSTRFKSEFMEVQKKLTLEGNIVISVGLFGHSGDSEVWENMDEGNVLYNLETWCSINQESFAKIQKLKKAGGLNEFNMPVMPKDNAQLEEFMSLLLE